MVRLLLLSIIASTAAISAEPGKNAALETIIDRMILREQALLERLQKLAPLTETYIQIMQPEGEDELAVKDDHYFLGNVNLGNGVEMVPFTEVPKEGRRWFSMFFPQQFRFLPRGFAQMALVDNGGLGRSRFEFTYVRREFVGEIRSLVFDVVPKKDAGPGRFKGRIWADEQGFDIIRFSGTYTLKGKAPEYFHFNSWRVHTDAGWLPAQIYVEELDKISPLAGNLLFKAKVNFWGYKPMRTAPTDEFTKILVEADQASDKSTTARVDSVQGWQRQAEMNIVERMEEAGLLAPPGEVEQVLETVVNNVLVTNNLPDPGIKCRVLLTTPLESFAVNNTIILSRGLIDVLPDEGSLALILTRELAHILLGHQLDTKYAFNDRIMIDDNQILRQFQFRREPQQLEDADNKAVELLKNSPYKDKLEGAALFLRAASLFGPHMPKLFAAQMGNRVPQGDGKARMTAIAENAPTIHESDPNQIIALRLGSRLVLDPWSNKLELNRSPAVKFTSAREKMPFEVAPLMLPLGRHGKTTVAQEEETAAPAGGNREAAPATPAVQR